ncbi:MAG: ComEC/Rec2 family competence protein [Thermomicrobiales bacterium]|nr:ComEC/Rec2 family competence protein [Thermomicrobiales bacterium]
MTNGIALGLAALAGVWFGWPALLLVIATLSTIAIIERRWQTALVVACIIIAAIGAWRSPQAQLSIDVTSIKASTSATGRIAEFPRPSANGQRLVMELSEVCIEEQCIPATGRVIVYVPAQDPPVARGATIHVDWRFDDLTALTPGYRNYVESQRAIGSAISWKASVVSPALSQWQWMASANQAVVDRIQQYIPGDAGALATGIITGDDSALSDQAEADFLETGTSHVTAVSGQNVALIIGFLSMWYQPHSPRGRTSFHAILILVVWSYAIFVGLEPPALRAAIFATLMVLGRHVSRRPDPITILSLTLGAMALWNPWVVQTVGYWLSAIASMAICLTLPTELSHSLRGAAWQIARASVVASFATMPLILMTFGSWSPITVAANVLLNPIMDIAFPLCYLFAIVAVFLPFVAPFVAIIPTVVLNLALDTVHQLTLLPLAGSIRMDELTPLAAFILWIPIALWIWLISGESDRWLRRLPNPTNETGTA